MSTLFMLSPQVVLDKPDCLVYPAWLSMENTVYQPLFENVAVLREWYVVFWTHQNPACQKALSATLINKLNHLFESVINPWGTDMASHRGSIAQIEALNEAWGQTLAPLSSMFQTQDFYIRYEASDGDNIAIQGDAGLRAMTEGAVQEDFLWKHPLTEKAFQSFVLANWSKRLKSVERTSPL